MKIQFLGQNTFLAEGKDVKVVFEPSASTSIDSVDFVTNSGNGNSAGVKESKKVLSLPGEFEISEALANGYYSSKENVVFKVVMEDISLVHFGAVKEVPDSNFFDKLGENIDVVFVCLSHDFDEKKAKNLIEQIDPRMAILGGDASFFPKMVESMGAKTAEENPIKITKSQLLDDKTEVMILPI